MQSTTESELKNVVSGNLSSLIDCGFVKPSSCLIRCKHHALSQSKAEID